MKQEKSEYDIQAEKFLLETNSSIEIAFHAYDKHFQDDKEPRFIWNITLKSNGRFYTFKFGSSLNDVQIAFNKFGDRKISIPAKVIDDNDQLKYRKARVLAALKKDKIPEVIPSAYDILSCVAKDNPYDSFEDFCSNYGYDSDSRKAEKTYNAVIEQCKQIAILYDNSELEKLREIQ